MWLRTRLEKIACGFYGNRMQSSLFISQARIAKFYFYRKMVRNIVVPLGRVLNIFFFSVFSHHLTCSKNIPFHFTLQNECNWNKFRAKRVLWWKWSYGLECVSCGYLIERLNANIENSSLKIEFFPWKTDYTFFRLEMEYQFYCSREVN